MDVAILGSGSAGNGTVVRLGQRVVLLDCGFSVRETMARLSSVGLAEDDVAAIVVTHEHGDHLGGVAALTRRLQIPVFMTRGTADSQQHRRNQVDSRYLNFVSHGETLELNGIATSVCAVPHDAGEPVMYTFEHEGQKLAVVSDLGHVSEAVGHACSGCSMLLLEFNHDVGMLRSGPYPHALKRRVEGPFGHLNNDQASQFLARIRHPGLRHVVAIHLSETNNEDAMIQASLEEHVDVSTFDTFTLARQHQGSGWIGVHPETH